MEGPANTVNYMIAGYTVIFIIIPAYLISLVVRWRNLKQDEALLADIDKDQQ